MVVESLHLRKSRSVQLVVNFEILINNKPEKEFNFMRVISDKFN